jgi:regulator of replication initiation timing
MVCDVLAVLASMTHSWHHLPHSSLHEDRTRMAKQAVATRTDLDPIDRLEEKVRMLVGIVTQLRADHARTTEENSRLAREVDNLRGRLAESEAHGNELNALREERDLIRSRVAEMLEQLEAI